MGAKVYFHCHQLLVSEKNEKHFFSNCFDAVLEKTVDIKVRDPKANKDDIYATITYGELMLQRTDIFKEVRKKLIRILIDDWSKIFKTVEVNNKSDEVSELYSFAYWNEVYVDANATFKEVKPSVRVICFYSDLYEVIQKFIKKTLE